MGSAAVGEDTREMKSGRAASSRGRTATFLLGVTLLAAVSFFWFPGHTMLQSDTQIYIPILQHLENPAVLQNDIMAVRPHVSFTIYDELTLLVRKLGGVSFETALLIQQFVYRGIAIWGLFLLATGAGFATVPALIVAALCSLGATVLGPAVLTVEYEPVPRGFALPFLLLSLGALAHHRWTFSGIAAAIGFMLHPPTLLAYCGLLLIILLAQRKWRDAGTLMLGPGLLLLMLFVQPPSPERPPFFARIDPALEALQRMRAPYNYVSLWIGGWWMHYTVLTVAGGLAVWRVRHLIPETARLAFVALPAMGWLSLPVSYVLLEQMKWILIPQLQPGRHLLFATFFAVIACSLAAVHAAVKRRYVETALFLLVPLLIPQETNVTTPAPRHVLLAAGMAAAGAIAMRSHRTAILAAVLPFVLIPTVGQVRNYAEVHTEGLDQLAWWARTSTPQDAVFQFAGARRQLHPGVFRVRAQRALYVDWKGGGQMNFLRSFADTWITRWRAAETAKSLDDFRKLGGIDYVVYPGEKAPSGAQPAFSNGVWVAYRLR
jgi:hypothetical protein